MWYSIATPDKVTIYQIKGDVEEIERSGGKTEVIVDEGLHVQATYKLDETLISFGTALEDGNLVEAAERLDKFDDLTPETEAMWQQLYEVSMEGAYVDLHTAARCAAAVGDVARSRYLQKMNKVADKMQEECKAGERGEDHWKVQSRLALMRKDLKKSERILVEAGKSDEAIEMYQTLHRWDEAIMVAQEVGHGDAAQMKRDYFDYLRDTSQEEKAAELKEQEGQYMEAIELFLKGGLPGRAAQVVKNHQVTQGGPQLMERIAGAMTRCVERFNRPFWGVLCGAVLCGAVLCGAVLCCAVCCVVL